MTRLARAAGEAALKAERAAGELDLWLRHRRESVPDRAEAALRPAGRPAADLAPAEGRPEAAGTTPDVEADAWDESARGGARLAVPGAAGAPLRLQHTDWLHHRLAVTGPSDALADFQAAASGAGVIPWRLDGDRLEEDLFHLLAAPPAPQRRRLSLAGARALARSSALPRSCATRRPAPAWDSAGPARSTSTPCCRSRPLSFGSAPTTRTPLRGCGPAGGSRKRCATSGSSLRYARRCRPGRRPCASASGRPTGRRGAPWPPCEPAGPRCASPSGRPTARCERGYGRRRGRDPGAGLQPAGARVGRPAADTSFGRVAGPGGRRVRGAARLAAGDGAREEGRPLPAVDRGAGRGVRARWRRR